MGLNIKNERVHALAREAAARTGLTQTSVIEKALEKVLADLDSAGDRPASSRQQVDRILHDVDGRLDQGQRARLRADDLYDESGLPA